MKPMKKMERTIVGEKIEQKKWRKIAILHLKETECLFLLQDVIFSIPIFIPLHKDYSNFKDH